MFNEYSGLIPVSVDMTGRRVELLELEGATYREPFLTETIDRSRRNRPAALNMVIKFERFVALAQRHGTAPHGFIFHVGRCGSTLLANMLMASGRHLLIKEPGTVSDLIAHWLNADDRTERVQTERLLAAMLQLLTAATGDARYKVFKFAAWNVRMADVLLNMFPETSSVFVYRPPAETVASMLYQPPAWFDLIRCPRQLQMRFFPTLGEVPATTALSPELLFAHAWKSTVEAALAQPPDRMALIEYHEMTDRPAHAIQHVLSVFEHRVNAGQIAAMADAARVYSKDPAGQARFEPASAHRRPPLTPAQEVQVRAAVGETWSRLESRRLSAANWLDPSPPVTKFG